MKEPTPRREDPGDVGRRKGPLAGLMVLEFAGQGPGPFACMLLADLGATVLRIDRHIASETGGPPAPPIPGTDILGRGRRAIALDLKTPAGRDLAVALADRADVLVEGFRPGVMERLGLGPATICERNPRLVYGRVTGWGQDGPLAQAAGHDINYIALAGALHLIGEPGGGPIPPGPLIGDFAGGGLLLAFGVLAALVERTASGAGQVVDAAMVEGAALLTTVIHGLAAADLWAAERGVNLLDGGVPYYDTYETSDGKWLAVGAIEPQFYAELVDKMEVDVDVSDQNCRATWSTTKEAFAGRFLERTRDEWYAEFGSTDACVAPVLSFAEAPDHEQSRSRTSFIEIAGIRQPAPAPRFERTPSSMPLPPPPLGGEGTEALRGWDVPESVVAAGLLDGALFEPARAAGPSDLPITQGDTK